VQILSKQLNTAAFIGLPLEVLQIMKELQYSEYHQILSSDDHVELCKSSFQSLPRMISATFFELSTNEDSEEPLEHSISLFDCLKIAIPWVFQSIIASSMLP